MRLKNLIITGATALVCGCSGVTTTASTAIGPSPAAQRQLWQPKTPVIGVTAAGVPSSYAGVKSFDTAVGVNANLVMYYSGWREDFKTAFADQANKDGATVLVNIDSSGASPTDIAAGKYDTYLKRFASEIAAFGHPVVVSFDHEMNGAWFTYGYRHITPAAFVAAWRHVYQVISQHTHLVTWMWTVNTYAGKRTEPLAPLYPGGSYVDVIGVDGYDWSGAQPMAKVFGSTIRDLRQIAPSKPMMVAETAVVAGPDAANQVDELFQVVSANRLLGLLWFDVDKQNAANTQDQHDWRIQDDPSALAAFRKHAPRATR